MEQILLAGDWHGNTSHAIWVVEKAARLGIKKIFQVGDFGAWEHEPDGRKYLANLSHACERNDVDVYWCDGNHDKWSLTVQLHGDQIDDEGFIICVPRVRYALRGHRWTWSGTRFLALGGAYSVDKDYRLQMEERRRTLSWLAHEKYGKKFEDHRQTLWFPEEEITDIELQVALGDCEPIDVMLCHDKPINSTPGWNRKDLQECWPNQARLQAVVETLKPSLYVHGHLHYFYHHAMLNGDAKTYVVGLQADNEAGSYEPGYNREQSVAVLTLGGEERTITLEGNETTW